MDRRIKKTESQILHATIRLLQLNPMHHISVKEICNEANISRSTFYLHYSEPKDVIEQLYNDVAITLTNVLDDFDFSYNGFDHKKFLKAIFDEIEMYKNDFAKMLTTNYHSNFRRRLKKILEDKIINDNRYRYKDIKVLTYNINFIISGLVECICDNIEDFFDDKQRDQLFDTLDKILSKLTSI